MRASGIQLYFEKSHSDEKDCQEGARMFTIPKQAIRRKQVFLQISHRRCQASLFQAFVVKKNIVDAIRPGRIWIEKVSFELSHVTWKRRLSLSERHRVSLLSLRL